MFITMCVIAYNEENAIDRILGDIAAQDYNHNDMEVVLVDGASTDNTKKHLDNFKEKYKDDFRRVVVLDNPKRTLPSGWNVALREYKGDAIIKVDAHAEIPTRGNMWAKKWLWELSSASLIWETGRFNCFATSSTISRS